MNVYFQACIKLIIITFFLEAVYNAHKKFNIYL